MTRTVWIAGGLALISCVLVAIGTALQIASGRTGLLGHASSPPIDIAFGLAMSSFPVLGAFIAFKRPANPIWAQLVGIGVFFGLVLWAGGYTAYGLDHPGSVPAPLIVSWLTNWLWAPAMGLFAQLILVFPTGMLPGPRWRAALWLIWGMVAVEIVGYAMGPNPLQALPYERPFVVAQLDPLFARVQQLGDLLLAGVLLVAAAALIARFRRSSGAERQQLKWVAYSSSLVAVATLGTSIATLVMDPFELFELVTVPFAIVFASVPASAAIAVLRYRLYDIDLLINRTVVYGAVSAISVVTYATVVVLSQAALRPFTSGNELAVAASTLFVVALFQPIRGRVQGFVDRRFYRSRYDAARTLDAFGARLRRDVEIESVRADLLGVVDQTVRPAHASLWLR